MSKIKVTILILICVIISLLANIFLAGSLSARLSTFRLFGKFRVLNPQAPIVINTREEVRANDNQDVLNALDKAKARLSLVVFTQGGEIKVAGAAINITSDGLFITAKTAVEASKTQNLVILLNDGRTAAVSQVWTDPGTGVAMLKADINGVPVSDLAKSADAVPGQRIIFLSSSILQYSGRFQASFVSFAQNDTLGQVFDTDRPSMSFGVQPTTNLTAGQSLANLDGQIMGMFDGARAISSDVIRSSVRLFLDQKSSLARPAFGFHYRIIDDTQSKLLSLPAGAQLARPVDNQPSVLPNSSAAFSGLQEADIITSVDGTKIDRNNTLEDILQRYKPGDKIKFSVIRGSNSIDFTLTAGTLK